MKVIIGSDNTKKEGWINTQKGDLNLLSLDTFSNMFPEKNIDCFLAEHVWEHLSFEEGIMAAKNCYKYLKPGGYLRITVPDKNFRNEWYQNIVQVGGPGPEDHPAFTHKIVYDYKLLERMLSEAGFITNLLE